MSEKPTATEFLYAVMRGEVKLAGADRVDIGRFLAGMEARQYKESRWAEYDDIIDRITVFEERAGVISEKVNPEQETTE